MGQSLGSAIKANTQHSENVYSLPTERTQLHDLQGFFAPVPIADEFIPSNY